MLPITLNLREKNVLVVGGGLVALEKIKKLKKAHAQIRVVAPEISPKIKSSKNLKIFKREFRVTDLKNTFLLIAATDDKKLQKYLRDLAVERGILLNIVDDPTRSDICFAADFSCGDLSIAVSTMGASPRVAQLIRDELASSYGREFAKFLKFLRSARERLKKQLSSSRARQTFWRKNLTAKTLERIRAGKIKEVQKDLNDLIKSI